MIREFKNGNIHLKFDSDELRTAIECDDFYKNYELAGALLDSVDCNYIADFYSLGNSNQAIDIYNVRTGLLFTMLDDDFIDLQFGKTVKLIARKPTEEQQEILNEWDFD